MTLPTPPPRYLDVLDYTIEETAVSSTGNSIPMVDGLVSKTPIYILLLSKPRLLVALWAVSACSVLLTSLGNVSHATLETDSTRPIC